jgi:hypothetical protein
VPEKSQKIAASQSNTGREAVFGEECDRIELAGSEGRIIGIEVKPNVELTGAARLYRAASSDRRERG